MMALNLSVSHRLLMRRYQDKGDDCLVGSYHLLFKGLGHPVDFQSASAADIGVGPARLAGGADDESSITNNAKGYPNPRERAPGP